MHQQLSLLLSLCNVVPLSPRHKKLFLQIQQRRHQYALAKSSTTISALPFDKIPFQFKVTRPTILQANGE